MRGSLALLNPTKPKVQDASGYFLERAYWRLGNLWLFPGGNNPEVEAPLRVRLPAGLLLVPPPRGDAVIGMKALAQIGARVEIDFGAKVFSVLVPEDVVRAE
jgi:hypothetical protein